ncbi:hypothetical protein K431DRAFT_330925 [Polychaeton citri CBS 116435]|uniref:Phosphoribosyltransferase domain-containing protein n=1 Tax=Polychaeton citri CBS 116435 TaxID=1314669 RepID=A0A9P4UP35_9PEZI|nr:hypothetical protein K431DRAFT_330925 [Polychaeton citri CBS 116435]
MYSPMPPTEDKPIPSQYTKVGEKKAAVIDVLSQAAFSFHEGSEVMSEVIPGGLARFHCLPELARADSRKAAIKAVAGSCHDTGRARVMAGYLSLWPDENSTYEAVHTQSDLETYTHILYLEIPCQDDKIRSRSLKTVSLLEDWQEYEITLLSKLCLDNGILFRRLSSLSTLLEDTVELLQDFRLHHETHNQACAETRIDEILSAYPTQPATMLVVDGDKTISADDTGDLFWNNIKGPSQPDDQPIVLKTLFSSRLGYSYTAFRQAMLLYEKVADNNYFKAICGDVFIFLFRSISAHEHVQMIVVTCGLRCIWEAVLDKLGLSEHIKVVEGGRLADRFVVTPLCHGVYVWAIDDSPLDIGMLSRADQAIVVAGEERSRSKTIEDDGLKVRQALLPEGSPPRLHPISIPIARLDDDNIINALACRVQVSHATDDKTAKLLMMPMRDVGLTGPRLREAHRRWSGTEECKIFHVQSHQRNTCIIALMRGGEAMAFGVNDALSLAMFFHAKSPDGVELDHLEGLQTVMLVASMINSGKTIIQFIQRIHHLCHTVRVVVVAGVIQAKFLACRGPLHSLDQSIELGVVALRLSDNMYTGTGTTDTGNRLFNTTHMP